MRGLRHGAIPAGGSFEGLAGIPPQQMDSELEDYSSDESDESDEDLADVNGQSPGSYNLPFQGETSQHYLKFGAEVDTINGGIALAPTSTVMSKSTNTYIARNVQLAGQMGLKSRDVLGVANQPMQASVPNISPVEKENAVKKPSSSFVVVEVKKDGNISDSEVRRVPDMSGKADSASAKAAHVPGPHSSAPSRKRGGASTDKEHKRMKRLLRNRVSAQQARERKKAYLSELELKSKELEQKNAELQEKVSTLQRENFMLRQIVKNTTLKNADGN